MSSNSEKKESNDAASLLGTVIVTAYGGRDLPNKDFFGRMDPYLRLTLDQVNFQKTSVHKSGGKNPVWNETFALEIRSEGAKRALTIECWDWDRVGKDLVGRNEFLISRIIKNGEFFDWIPLWGANGKAAGEVRLDIKFVPPPPPKKDLSMSPTASVNSSDTTTEPNYFSMQYVATSIPAQVPNCYSLGYNYPPEPLPFYPVATAATYPRPPERKIYPSSCGSLPLNKPKDSYAYPIMASAPMPQSNVNSCSPARDYVVPSRSASLRRS